MVRFHNYDIVFSEIPNETTLAINISGCNNRCEGCHSPWLWDDNGEVLTECVVDGLLAKYGSQISCICFMGGDGRVNDIIELAKFVKSRYKGLKIGWYSGRESLMDNFPIEFFDFVKLGRYIKELGGLGSVNTNQRFYLVENRIMVDATCLFLKENFNN